jgi:cell division protein FtsZ
MPKRRDTGSVLRREPAVQQSQAETRSAAQGSAGQPAPTQQPVRVPQPVGASGRPATGATAAPVRSPEHVGASARSGYGAFTDTPSGPSAARTGSQPAPAHFDDDELDVPDFLK